jgi:hypothetical protein
MTDRTDRPIDLMIDGHPYVAVPAATWKRIQGIDLTPAKGLAGTDAVAYMRQRIAKELRDMRRKAGLTQVALASALRITQAQVANIEAGRSRIGEAAVGRWAKACGSRS